MLDVLQLHCAHNMQLGVIYTACCEHARCPALIASIRVPCMALHMGFDGHCVHQLIVLHSFRCINVVHSLVDMMALLLLVVIFDDLFIALMYCIVVRVLRCMNYALFLFSLI